MSEELSDRQTQRELRGTAIRALGSYYGRTPDTASFDTVAFICRVGRSRPEQRMLELALQMLIDLGYVQRESDKRDALDRDPKTVFRLTGKGMQLLNGDIADASIAL